MANATPTTTSLAKHSNSLWEAMGKLSDAMAVVSVGAENDETTHGIFNRVVHSMLEDAFEQLEKVRSDMQGEAA